MPRLRLDPTSPNGVSHAPEATRTVLKQSHGYVTENIRGLLNAGSNVTISGEGTKTSPYQISASGGGVGGGVASVVAGTNISVDNTDPSNPIVSATDTTGISETLAIAYGVAL